jgi:SAM-dependent methyltransferase
MSSEPATTPETSEETTAAAAEPGWADYYRYTLGREPRPLFSTGLAALAAAGVTPGLAVDVGAGDGTETLALLEAGWRVVSVDSAPESAEVLLPRVPDACRARLVTLTAPVESADLPPFHLLYSGYALSFLDPDAFRRLWATVRDRLQPGGFLVVNIFGDRHAWAGSEPGTTFLPRTDVERLLDGLEIVAFEEVEEDGGSFSGPTHWHLFDIVARRPA